MPQPHPINVDYLIIGQGLAGSALAIKLLQRGKSILVIDQPQSNASSRVAAGLFNPITGRKMVKTWMADKLFPALHTHYRACEALTGNTFFHPLPVYRPFVSIEEQNEWMGRSSAPEFFSYIDKIYTAAAVDGVKDSYGGLLLKQCGYLDTSGYLNSVRDLLNKGHQFLDAKVTAEELVVGNDLVHYQNYRAGKVVFCHGTHDNSWFNWLPVRPLKGEALLIETEQRDRVIINRGVYVVPALNGQWRVGATYNYGDTTTEITGKSRIELIERLQDLIQFPFTIAGQEWGLRPTTPDRRPLLGRHPEKHCLWVFNGLGTKGVSLAPYFADVLIHSMENGEPLNKEEDIERYKLLYWTSAR